MSVRVLVFSYVIAIALILTGAWLVTELPPRCSVVMPPMCNWPAH